jgi:hypothetical protein
MGISPGQQKQLTLKNQERGILFLNHFMICAMILFYKSE